MAAMSGTTMNEDRSLIAASKVNGTYVYNAAGENLGSIYDVMIDKRSGQVAYAIMSFGGFLGMGDSYHPLPWNQLKYDVNKGGYLVNLDKRQLQNAPSYTSSTTPDWDDRAYGRSVNDYYSNTGGWGSQL
jgi:sporulation protein YlmC with PRC-barrel domain